MQAGPDPNSERLIPAHVRALAQSRRVCYALHGLAVPSSTNLRPRPSGWRLILAIASISEGTRGKFAQGGLGKVIECVSVSSRVGTHSHLPTLAASSSLRSTTSLRAYARTGVCH